MYFLDKHKVSIASNVKFDGFFEQPRLLNPDIVILEKSKIRLRKDKLKRIDWWFFGKNNENFVFFDDTFLGLRNIIILSNLYEKTTEIVFNKNVRLLDKFYPPRSRKRIKDLIDAVISIKQLQKGIIPIHAACLAQPDRDEAILLAGYPNIGKTLATLHFLERGYRYLSDDVILVDSDGVAYKNAFPSAVGYEDFLRYTTPKEIGRFKYYSFYLKGYPMAKSKILNRLIRPPLINLARLSKVKTAKKATVKSVYIIENGENCVEKLSTNDAHKLISNINRYCIGEINNPVIDTYNYFNPSRVFWIEQEKQKILSEFLHNKTCYRVSCNDFNWWKILNEH